jgi:SPOR domain
MTDDNIVRSYRSSDAGRRAGVPVASRDSGGDIGGGDPLAELARLIGQADPFTELDRPSTRASDARQPADSTPSDWRKTAAAMARESMMREPPSADPRFDEVESAITAAKSLRAPPNDRYSPPAEPYSPHDYSYRDSRSYASQNYASQSYSSQSYSSHDAASDQVAAPHGHYADGAYNDQPPVGGRFDDQVSGHGGDRLHDQHLPVAQQDGHESENYFFDGATAPADGRFYDDPPRARAANGLVTAIVLVGCGILGTAGAYGYRTYYSGPRSTDAPIISADKSAIKVMPAPADGDAQSGKSVQGRVGSVNERVVTRQEEPVAIPDPSGPRVVLPAPFTPSPGPGPAVVPPNPMSASVAGEPKKVHTVAIRPPDGSDPMGRPVSSGAPLQTAPSVPVASARSPSPAKPAGGGPLSLQPGQAGDASPSYQAPRATADAAPANGPRLASAVAPSGSAVASSGSAGGAYVVQISSQRSEADAQASFRSLQAKFPSQLGDREAIVRRADLGPKGVYYRAMVGPFGTAGDADQFCGGLKAAGGQCIVQKN